jgi:hypothetical protein
MFENRPCRRPFAQFAEAAMERLSAKLKLKYFTFVSFSQTFCESEVVVF